MNSQGNMADRVTAAVLFLLGLAMAWGGFDMDRLEIRRIHPASIPGLVPMILGTCLMICAAFLALAKVSENDDEPKQETMDIGNWADLAFTAAWSCVFAIFLVGSMPFVAASALYIGVFSVWFLWPQKSETAGRLKMIVLVVIYAALMAAGISALFQYGFLVRLP